MKIELTPSEVRQVLAVIDFRARLEDDSDTGFSNYFARELWALYHKIKGQIPSKEE